MTILKEGGESSGSDSTTSDDTRNDVKLMRGSYLLALLGGEGSRQTKINDGHEMQSASETTRIYP